MSQPSNRTNHLLVLGAGAKSAALHVFSASLKRLGLADIRVTSFERRHLSAHWTGGASGLTDGSATLGTSPLKDVSYPGRSTFGAALDQELSRYSWTSYLRHQHSYAAWVDRGAPQPSHREWSAYLAWCHAQTDATVVLDEVVHVIPSNDGVDVELASGESFHGDGFVYTGPGRPRRLIESNEQHPRIFDGRDFWSRGAGGTGALKGRVLVVGCGETAAAIFTRLARVDRDLEIYSLTTDGLLRTRDESFPTNTWYSDPSGWTELPLHVRREIFRGGDRGVLSAEAQRTLAATQTDIHSIRGRFVAAEPMEDRVVIDYDDRGTRHRASFDYAISAMGFDLAGSVESILDPRFGLTGTDESTWETGVDHHLRIPTVVGSIHVPGLAALAQGPGFPNLSCLSTLADRILITYA